MSEPNPLNRTEPTGGSPMHGDKPHGWKETAADAVAKTEDAVARTQEKARELGRTAIDKVESGRHATADALRSTADTLHRAADSRMGMDRVMDATHRTADKIGNVADYVRDHDSKQMMDDVGGFVRKYPGQSLLAGVIAGFLIGRAFRRSSYE